MSDERKTSFRLGDLEKASPFGQQLRDKDNAQMRPKPPERIDNPRLAPGGSVGIRLNRMPPPATLEKAPPAQRPTLKLEVGKPSDINREFKSLVSKVPTKGHER